MSEMATYIGVTPRTITANAALVRGVRVSLNSAGSCDVQDASATGDYVTLAAIEAAKPGPAAAMFAGEKVPALASEATNVGDPAYTAANGKFSKTSTNATLVGKWVLAASGDGVLGEVELEA